MSHANEEFPVQINLFKTVGGISSNLLRNTSKFNLKMHVATGGCYISVFLNAKKLIPASTLKIETNFINRKPFKLPLKKRLQNSI